MDRRQKKTRTAIFRAFSTLLQHKHFNRITVQDIIDEANVGRSTFYAHFETKEELLRSLCTDIFQHVFADEPDSEKTHDYSHGYTTMGQRIEHLLFHLSDHKEDFTGLFATESSGLFMRYFKEYLTELFTKYECSISKEVPDDFKLNYLSGSFAETVKWWLTRHPSYTPVEIARFYMKMVE